MEKPSTNAFSPYIFVDILQSVFLRDIIFWVTPCHKFYSTYFPFIPSQLRIHTERKNKLSENDENLKIKPSEPRNEEDGAGLSRQDIQMVMDKLEIFCNPEGDSHKDWLATSELAEIFYEGLSLENIKDAFCVFDQNNDGFIDEKELQRVLLCLGCREGSSLSACEQMIAAYDKNKDGKIDFNEFEILLNNSFC